jgi:acyl-CoA synthetase (AMP-forming)/AMP-acid ligase II
VQPGDVCDIIFTSGTTGRPKGARVTHYQNLRVFSEWADMVGLAEGDQYLIINPFFHTFGYKAGMLAALMKGATMYPVAVFDVDAAMEMIERERISMIPGSPTLYQAILNSPRRSDHDLSSLRLAVTGGSVVPVSLVEEMRSELGFDLVLTAYGLTESTGVVTICSGDDDPETIATTVGRPIREIEVRVVDDDNVEVPRGEPGEIVVRGYNVMLGYINDPEETAAAIDAAGWLHTGDIGTMDENDYVKITDRKKDMYIVGGFNAYPAEIENIMLTHPKIAQVAVIGVPDDLMGEVGAAYVIRRTGEELTADEVLAWCRENMANFKVPRHAEIVDSLPLTPSGKVVKYELRERYGKL